MCLLEYFKCCVKKDKEKKEDIKSIEVKPRKQSMDSELIEPAPYGYEKHVRVNDLEDNDFGDPRGQRTMQVKK